MRRAVDDEVAAAARRRLELLRAELGIGAQDRTDLPAHRDGSDGPPADVPVAATGRHSRRTITLASRVEGWVGDRLPAALRGRIHLGGRELALVALVALGGLVVAAVVTFRARGGDAAAAPAAGPSTTPSALVTPATAAASSGSPGGSDRAKVVVDVAGKVRHPGVLHLPKGSRVVDAIRRAGGARHGVDLSGINLARVVTDGEQILVGRAPVATSGGALTSAHPSSGSGPLVDLNTATEEQLETLPGVGPVTAQKILEWRQGHGSFTDINELLEVDGIGTKTLADLKPYVTL